MRAIALPATRLRSTVAVLAGVMVGLAALIHGTAWADSGSGGDSEVVSVPVSFDVVTRNGSGLPCATLSLLPFDRHFTVRGHLTGKRSELDSNSLEGTLYTHGDGYDESFWRYQRDERYNFVDDMARRGHVSVTYDRLGYGDSDRPNGNNVCFGTEADVAHQIIRKLRRGDYHGERSPSFHRIGLVGHSAGGFVVEEEAAGFHDIDALGVLDSGELDVTPLVAVRAGQQQMRCLTKPRGYAGLEANGEQFRHDHLHNVEPDIAHYLISHRTDDACAGTRNALQTIAGDGIRNSTIRVPVLLLAGANDMFFQHIQLQAKTYSRSRKVTVHEIPATGHAVAFSREHQKFNDRMNDWLDDNHL